MPSHPPTQPPTSTLHNQDTLSVLADPLQIFLQGDKGMEHLQNRMYARCQQVKKKVYIFKSWHSTTWMCCIIWRLSFFYKIFKSSIESAIKISLWTFTLFEIQRRLGWTEWVIKIWDHMDFISIRGLAKHTSGVRGLHMHLLYLTILIGFKRACWDNIISFWSLWTINIRMCTTCIK